MHGRPGWFICTYYIGVYNTIHTILIMFALSDFSDNYNNVRSPFISDPIDQDRRQRPDYRSDTD